MQIRAEKLYEQSVKIKEFVKALKARAKATKWAAKGRQMSQADANEFALGYLIAMAAQGALDSKTFRDEIEERHASVELSAKLMEYNALDF